MKIPLNRATSIPLVILYELLFRADRECNDQHRVGALQFRGSSDFIDCCRDSATRLAYLDQDIFQYLTSGKRTVFWLHPANVRRPIWNISFRFFSISNSFYAWRTDGILSILAFVYFIDHAQSRDLPKSERRQFTSKNTSDWLKRHSFPEELIESFGKEAQQGAAANP